MSKRFSATVRGFIGAAAAITIALSMAACTDPSTGADGESQGVVPIYTPRQGGSAYVVGGGIANLMSSSIDGVQGSVEATTGTQEMIERLRAKQDESQPAFIIADSAGQARSMSGDFPFEEPYADLRALAYLHDTAVHLVVRGDSSISGMQDLEGATIGLGVPGSPMNFLTKEVLEAHGVSEGSYEELPYGYEEVADGLNNGTIDAGVIGGAIPVSTLTELAAQVDVRVLPVDAAVMAELEGEAPYLFPLDIPGGTYNGIEEEVTTYGFSASLSTHKDTPDALVTSMLEIVYDQTDELAQVHASANAISLDDYDKGIAIDLHPAALAFYEERGVSLEG
ncbi:MAG: TAXI family TRAP transporter solute-binding subunit [Pseudoclavibacter sp.]